MTSKEYVIWLKGFVEACHEYAPTPKQWDALKDKLAEVTDTSTPSFPFGVPNTSPNTPPMWQHPHYPNPLDNPYKITCSSGSVGTITTTPGYGSLKFNPVTSTAYGYPSGSAWHYTNGGNNIKD
jgi:hypothetical protein